MYLFCQNAAVCVLLISNVSVFHILKYNMIGLYDPMLREREKESES